MRSRGVASRNGLCWDISHDLVCLCIQDPCLPLDMCWYVSWPSHSPVPRNLFPWLLLPGFKLPHLCLSKEAAWMVKV